MSLKFQLKSQVVRTVLFSFFSHILPFSVQLSSQFTVRQRRRFTMKRIFHLLTCKGGKQVFKLEAVRNDACVRKLQSAYKL